MTQYYIRSEGGDVRCGTRSEWRAMISERGEVIRDDYVGRARVSTIFLGLGEPRYETMIFGGPYDQECWRYASEAEALVTHHRIVADLWVGRDPRDDEAQP